MKNLKKYQREIIGGVIIAVLAFWGGMMYANRTNANSNNSQNTSGQGVRGTGFRGQRGFGGVFGQVVSKDATSITVEMRDGSGSKVVFYTGATPILKDATGTIDDVKVGESVSINGTPNSDGSVSAQSIQIRPAGFMGGAPGQRN